jgi:serine/threonine protein kinase
VVGRVISHYRVLEKHQALGRFKEAQAVSSLSHPNICMIYDIDEHDGQPFIAMELLKGQSLSTASKESLLLRPSSFWVWRSR